MTGRLLPWPANSPGAKAELSVKAIAAGQEHSLALTSDRTVWEWGARLPVQPFGETRQDEVLVEVQEIVAKFRCAFPDLCLSTDVICGFPGESGQSRNALFQA
jgi:alpha-tubulin suppressor-like RCC1 family protein